MCFGEADVVRVVVGKSSIGPKESGASGDSGESGESGENAQPGDRRAPPFWTLHDGRSVDGDDEETRSRCAKLVDTDEPA